MESEGSEVRGDGGIRNGERRMRAVTAVAVAVATVIADILVLKFVVPSVDDEFPNPFMNPGYIVTFFLVFFNFVTALIIVSHMFHGDSYPSDRWQ